VIFTLPPNSTRISNPKTLYPSISLSLKLLLFNV